jgi:hypothetical protein
MSQRAYAIVVTVFAICLGVIAVTQRIELRELGFSPSEPPTENPAVERLTKLGGDAKSFVEGNIYFVAYH